MTDTLAASKMPLDRLASAAGRFLCLIGQHDYRLIHRICGSVQHIGCTRCKAEWGINHDAQTLLPWDEVSWLYEEEFAPGNRIYKADPAEVARRLDPANYRRKPRPT